MSEPDAGGEARSLKNDHHPGLAKIRLATPGDAVAIAAIYAPIVADSSISFEIDPPGEDEMRRRLTEVLEYAPWLVCERDGEILGYAYASRHHERAAYQWSVNAAIYIRSDSHRHGIGRALYGSLFELLKLQGFCAAHAGVTLPNAGSIGLHESIGFRLVGVYPAVGFKFGAWHDVGWWQLPLRDRVGPPAPLLTMAELARHRDGKAALAAGLPLLRI